MSLFNRVKAIFIIMAILGVAFAVLRELYWHRPEIWNGTAEGYYAHVESLKIDSVSKVKTIVRLRRDSTVLAENNNKLSTELQTAIKYGEEWQGKYVAQVATSDAFVDRIQENERDLALYKKLYKNGTLSPVNLTMSKVRPIDITTASLKTANRLEQADTVIIQLNKAFSVSQAAVKRLGSGLQSFSSGSKDISINLRKKAAKKTFLGIGKGLKKAMIEEADNLDNLRTKANEESDLERTLNPK